MSNSAKAFLDTNPSDDLLDECISAAAAHGAALIAERDRRAGFTTASTGSLDPGCICFGNWRLIVNEVQPNLDKIYVEVSTGDSYSLIGVLHGSDDFYYAMYDSDKGLRLLSCVGSIEGMGFELKENVASRIKAKYSEIEELQEKLKRAEMELNGLLGANSYLREHGGLPTMVGPGECIKCGGSNTGPCTVADHLIPVQTYPVR